MDLKNFYETVGGSYDEIKSRLPTDELIEKFVRMLPQDESYANLNDAMAKEDWKAAFTAIHTLKGVTANLSLTGLYNSACALTEDLRSGTPSDSTKEDYEKLKADYEKVVCAINAGGAQ